MITIPPKLFKFDFSQYFEQESLETHHIEYPQPSLVYPNPGHSSITISGKTGSYSIYEYPNMKLVLSGNKGSDKIDISTLNIGTYLLEINGLIYKIKKGQ